ncbi:MAG: Rrf2 family transcriptional regulator [Rhodobacteraceae bacterium]|nr:Rrf2 family transcriptional regulator [Paracoccaceae bacterium]
MQKSSRLAIFALIELASNPDRQISTAEIGDKYRVSSHHLAKVMLTLGRAGLVQSIRGVGGGYSFTGNAKRTTLQDVISLFEDTTVTCKLPDPSIATSAEWEMFNISKEINDISVSTHRSITLSTMLKHIERRDQIRARKASEAANA